jgi:predicted permease
MWRRFFSKADRNADLEEELQAHLEIETRQLMDRGVPRPQAELEARRMFGSPALVMQQTREVRWYAGLARVWQDIRYGARVLRRSPAFTAAAVLSLALGIGATTAVFSIADTIFLRPLPYAVASRLTWVGVHDPSMSFEFVAAPDYVAWRRDNRAFDVLAAAQPTGSQVVLLGGADPVEVHMARVSANFLNAFAIAPAAGRAFRPEEEFQNGPKVAILTHQFWRDHFHERRDVIGSTITLDAQPSTVIGILPESFVYPGDVKVDLLTPLFVPPSASHRDRSIMLFAVFGRLKPGVTLAQARADLDQLYAASIADSPPMFRPEDRPVLQPLSEHRAGNVRTLLFILMGAAGCLLAIACANVANLLLARWSARSRELAVRAAIGAGRGRLARQLFAEIALLVAASTVVAMIITTAALRGFVYFAAGEFPRLGEVSTDLRVFGIALAVSVGTAVIFGGLPALGAGRVDLLSVLQLMGRGGASAGHGFARRALVLAEVALSVVLLSGSALLIQTLWHMQNDHLGFQPEHVLTVSIPLRGVNFRGPLRDQIASDVLTLLNRIPGTEAAALTECTPVYTARSSTFSRSDRPLPEPFHRGDSIGYCKVGSDYLKAAGTRLVQGRFFSPEDFHHPGTFVVINEAAARTYFPGESPLGKEILGGRGAPWKTVVGVVADSKNQGLNQPAAPAAFVNDTAASFTADLLVIVRSLAQEGAFARALREGLRADHPGLLTKVETLDQTIGHMTASPRFNTVLLSAFAAIAFLMAIVGVYGVLAFSVTQRRAEIGIRMALGATPRAVLALVMREGAVLVAAGICAGLAGSVLLTRYLKTLLYGVEETDPATYATVGIGLALAALTASFLPARRAAVVDPVVTLRHD